MPIFKRKNGISIYYEVTGQTNRNNGTFALLGGLTRDHTVWRKVIPALSTNYQVVTFDNRDTGQSTSTGDDYNISDLADDIAETLTYLNFFPVHLVGHSMGGFMAFHIAAKYPQLVKSLILCGTCEKQVLAGIEYLTWRIRAIEDQPTETATIVSRESVLAVMDKIYAPDSLKNAAFIEEIVTHETTNLFPQSASSFKRQANACINHDVLNLLEKITCPTLIVAGEHDKFYTIQLANSLASQIKSAKVVTVPHASHMMHLEQPTALYDTLRSFLTRL